MFTPACDWKLILMIIICHTLRTFWILKETKTVKECKEDTVEGQFFIGTDLFWIINK